MIIFRTKKIQNVSFNFKPWETNIVSHFRFKLKNIILLVPELIKYFTISPFAAGTLKMLDSFISTLLYQWSFSPQKDYSCRDNVAQTVESHGYDHFCTRSRDKEHIFLISSWPNLICNIIHVHNTIITNFWVEKMVSWKRISSSIVRILPLTLKTREADKRL